MWGRPQAAPTNIMPANRFNNFTDYGIGITFGIP